MGRGGSAGSRLAAAGHCMPSALTSEHHNLLDADGETGLVPAGNGRDNRGSRAAEASSTGTVARQPVGRSPVLLSYQHTTRAGNHDFDKTVWLPPAGLPWDINRARGLHASAFCSRPSISPAEVRSDAASEQNAAILAV